MDFVSRDDGGLQPQRSGPGVALRLLLALTIGGFFLGLLLSAVSPQELLSAFRRVHAEWLIGAVLAVGCAYALRAARWTLMLRQAGSNARFRDAAVPLLGSAALDNLLPLGAGDAIRVIALQSFAGPRAARPYGTLAEEKRFEVAAGVVVVLASALMWRPGRPAPALDPGLWVAAAAAILVCAVTFTRPAAAQPDLFPARSPRGRSRTAASVGGLSLAIVLTDACAVFAVAEALGTPRALPVSVFAAGLIGVSALLPAPPARLGVFDYLAALTASCFGASLAQALAFALLTHAVVWIATTVAGWRLLASADRIGVARGPVGHPV